MGYSLLYYTAGSLMDRALATGTRGWKFEPYSRMRTQPSIKLESDIEESVVLLSKSRRKLRA